MENNKSFVNIKPNTPIDSTEAVEQLLLNLLLVMKTRIKEKGEIKWARLIPEDYPGFDKDKVQIEITHFPKK